VFRLMQLLGLDKSAPSRAWKKPAAPGKDPDSGAALLVITRDSGFYAIIREIVSGWKWTVCQQTEAFPRANSGAMIAYPWSIVVYDGDLTDGLWKEAFVRLKATEGNPCILLASGVSDPYLWNEVIRCGGFDVIAKSAGREQTMRTLRFAWFWKKKPQASLPGSRHQTFPRH